jgi:hypothetical protein
MRLESTHHLVGLPKVIDGQEIIAFSGKPGLERSIKAIIND